MLIHVTFWISLKQLQDMKTKKRRTVACKVKKEWVNHARYVLRKNQQELAKELKDRFDDFTPIYLEQEKAFG